MFSAGLPLAFLIPWAVKMEHEMGPTSCWEGYAYNSWVWLIIGPRLIAVTVRIMSSGFARLVSASQICRLLQLRNEKIRRLWKYLPICFLPPYLREHLSDVPVLYKDTLLNFKSFICSKSSILEHFRRCFSKPRTSPIGLVE